NGDRAHRRQQLRAETARSARTRALRGEGTQSVRGPPSRQLAEDQSDRSIDPIWQGLIGAVPPERTSVPFGHHLVAVFVVQDELEIGQLGVETLPERA